MRPARRPGTTCVFLMIVTALASTAIPQIPSPPCTLSVETGAADPNRHLGDSVCWSGNVQDVVSSNIPIKLLVKTNKTQWLVMLYDPNFLDDRALNPKTKIFVDGTLYGTEKVTFEGVELRVPAVSATHISCADQRPRKQQPQNAPLRKVSLPKVPEGYKDAK